MLARLFFTFNYQSYLRNMKNISKKGIYQFIQSESVNYIEILKVLIYKKSSLAEIGKSWITYGLYSVKFR